MLMVIHRSPATGTLLELQMEWRSMLLYRSHVQRCFIYAVVDGISWSVGAMAVFVA